MEHHILVYIYVSETNIRSVISLSELLYSARCVYIRSIGVSVHTHIPSISLVFIIHSTLFRWNDVLEVYARSSKINSHGIYSSNGYTHIVDARYVSRHGFKQIAILVYPTKLDRCLISGLSHIINWLLWHVRGWPTSEKTVHFKYMGRESFFNSLSEKRFGV